MDDTLTAIYNSLQVEKDSIIDDVATAIILTSIGFGTHTPQELAEQYIESVKKSFEIGFNAGVSVGVCRGISWHKKTELDRRCKTNLEKTQKEDNVKE